MCAFSTTPCMGYILSLCSVFSFLTQSFLVILSWSLPITTESRTSLPVSSFIHSTGELNLRSTFSKSGPDPDAGEYRDKRNTALWPSGDGTCPHNHQKEDNDTFTPPPPASSLPPLVPVLHLRSHTFFPKNQGPAIVS